MILAGQPVPDSELDGSARLIEPDEDYWMLEWDESVGIPGGTRPVTAENAHAYIKQKAQYELIDSVRPELMAMREGMYDVIAQDDVRDLTVSVVATPCFVNFVC